MFRSSENLRLAAEMRALQRVAAPWRAARSTWFDGTPESIAARLAATERVLSYAKGGLTTAHLGLAKEASAARAELLAAQHRLLTDFLDDGARAFKGSKRVALDLEDGLWEGHHCQQCGKWVAPSGSHYSDDDNQSVCRDCFDKSDSFKKGSKRVAGDRLRGYATDSYEHGDEAFRCPDCGNIMHADDVDGHYADYHPEVRPHDDSEYKDNWYNSRQGSTRVAGGLGPGYDDRPGFGPEDLDEYDDYLHRHDYHTDPDDLHALEHKLRPGLDEDDPARYSFRRTADESTGFGWNEHPSEDDPYESEDPVPDGDPLPWQDDDDLGRYSARTWNEGL